MAKKATNKAKASGNNLASDILKRVFSDTLDAAKVAATRKTGELCFDRLHGFISPDAPDMVKQSLDTPLRRLTAANVIHAVGQAQFPDEPAVSFVTDAMLAASAHDLVESFRIPDFLYAVKAGEVSLNPDTGELVDTRGEVKTLARTVDNGGDELPGNGEGVEGGRNTASLNKSGIGQNSDGTTFKVESSDGADLTVSEQHELQFQRILNRGDEDMNAAIKERREEAKKSGLVLCPRCVARCTTPQQVRELKLVKNKTMGKYNIAADKQFLVPTADKWNGQTICGTCRNELNKQVSDRVKYMESLRQNAQEVETLKGQIDDMETELFVKQEDLKMKKESLAASEAFLKEQKDDTIKKSLAAGIQSTKEEIAAWEKDIEQLEAAKSELEGRLSGLTEDGVTVEDDDKVESPNAKEATTPAPKQPIGAKAKAKGKKGKKGKGKK